MTFDWKFSLLHPHRYSQMGKSLALAAICALSLVPAGAQVTAASLSGSVTDPSGAALPNATVTALNTGTGASQTATTTGEGTFTFTTLPPGTYRVTVAETGFATKVQEGLQLTVSQSATLNTVLTVGAQSESVTVDAAAGSLINASTAEISSLVNEHAIKQLPLNGRDPSSLVLLAPGVTNVLNASGTLQAIAAFPTESGASANGGRQGSTYYLLDGVQNMDTYLLLAAPFPNADATQEFRVITNNFDARYGFAPGAVVSIQTKSGSNQLHGGAFEFLRNSALNAGNYFSHHVDPLRRNQFGGYLGGPIVKNKLFFFANYQQTLASTTATTNVTNTPTAAMLAGDFSAVPLTLRGPFTTIGGKRNQVNPALLAAPAIALSKQLPLGVVPSTGQVTYTGASQKYSYKEATGRLDWDVSASHRVSVRSFIDFLDQPALGVPGNVLTYVIGERGRIYNELISDTWTISPKSVNTLSAAWLQNDYYTAAHVLNQDGSPFCLSQIINISDPAGVCYIEGGVSISGAFNQGYSSPNTENRRTWTLNDDYSRIIGQHVLTIGGNLLRQYANEISAYPANPQVNFNGQYTGFGLADFLLGDVQSFGQGAGEVQNERGFLLGIYAQDAWRIKPNLTLTAGVRWEPNLPPSLQNGRGAAFIPGQQSTRYPNAPTGMVFPGDTGVPNSLIPRDYTQVAPRIGIAWQPRSLPNTAFRAAFGTFFAPLEYSIYNHTADISPFSPTYSFTGTQTTPIPFSSPWTSPQSGTGGLNPFPPFASASQVPGPTATFPTGPNAVNISTVFSQDFKLARTQSWNLSVEQRLPGNLALHLAYVGSETNHLQFPLDLNPGIYSKNPALNGARTIYPAFSRIQENVSGGNASYNSLQVGLEKRLSHNLQFQSNFTWSRNEDLFTANSISFVNNIPNPFNPKQNFGRSDLNIPLISVTNLVYTTPSLTNHNVFVRGVLGSWQVSDIYTMQSGTPFSIQGGSGNNNSGAQQGGDRADFAPGVSYGSAAFGIHSGSKQQWLNRYFDTTKFVQNAPGTFGNTPRNLFNGPGINTSDLGLMKNWMFEQRFNLQFRWEMFNAFNHPNFANPNTSPTSGNFGQVTTIGPVAPRVQQAALKLTF
jgi:hypothetical protein